MPNHPAPHSKTIPTYFGKNDTSSDTEFTVTDADSQDDVWFKVAEGEKEVFFYANKQCALEIAHAIIGACLG